MKKYLLIHILIYSILNGASIKLPIINKLENADLILRRGYGVDSIIAMNFSEGEKKYSHAGIIYKTNDRIFVIHSEDDSDHEIDGVSIITLNEFLNNTKQWAIYRFKLSNDIKKKIISLALQYSSQKIKFDNDFDLKDDNKMYCSEFIYKIVNRSSGFDVIVAGKKVLSRVFVTISDLYENRFTYLIQDSSIQ